MEEKSKLFKITYTKPHFSDQPPFKWHCLAKTSEEASAKFQQQEIIARDAEITSIKEE